MDSTVDATRTTGLPLAERTGLLTAVAARVRAHLDDLEDAALSVFPFPRRVIRADIELAIDRLAAIGELAGALAHRNPVGTVALALPGNAVLSNPAGAIGAAVLAGNRVTVRLPARRRRWSIVLADLMKDIGSVTFSPLGGREFIVRVLDDPGTGAVMMFGDDRWAGGHEAAVRHTRTRFVFEGPGVDPFLVLDPATVDQAAAAAVEAGCFNAGQACTSPERFYVISPGYQEFVDRVIDLTARLHAGDPADPDTEIGPLAPAAAERLAAQIADAVGKGATVVPTGRPRMMTVNGIRQVLVPPVVLAGVDHTMAVMREETFGPVLAIQRVRSIGEAVDRAEDCQYGLSATVFGGTDEVVHRLARSHGRVFVGETWLDHRRRHPLAPYGGRRCSGWVWDWRGNVFIRRDGPRHNVVEFSVPRVHIGRVG